MTRPHRTDELVDSANFVRAVRDSGYVSLSTAIAELVDNSIQAKATEVSITIARATEGLPVIAISDNGVGMSSRELSSCLRFGGTSRFNGRSSFGRFGMGLPAASLSQTRRVEVLAWQQHRVRIVTLDVDSIVAGSPVDLSAKPAGTAATPSGCQVVWHECDRIEYRRLAWQERALHRDLGRMYRRYLPGKLRLSINGKRVEANDPTMLTAEVEGASAELAFAPLTYEITTKGQDTAHVDVRFSILPVHAWHGLDNVTKRRLGVVGQGGVSIVRAGREIAFGWHLMGSKRKENYDDWWRCEIDFDPRLDEHFGITINKQGIRPSRTLRDALEPELESVARLLNVRVRQAFEDVKFQVGAATSCRIAAATEPELSSVKGQKAGGPLNYQLGAAVLPGGLMYLAELSRRALDVTLNADHPAFAALYQPLQSMNDSAGLELRTAVELLLLAHVRASYQLGVEGNEMLRVWSETYARMLRRA